MTESDALRAVLVSVIARRACCTSADGRRAKLMYISRVSMCGPWWSKGSRVRALGLCCGLCKRQSGQGPEKSTPFGSVGDALVTDEPDGEEAAGQKQAEERGEEGEMPVDDALHRLAELPEEGCDEEEAGATRQD